MSKDLLHGMGALMSRSEFAEHVGLSKGRISQLIQEGLPILDTGVIDAETGKRWIEENIDRSRSRRAKKAGERDSGWGAATKAKQEKAEIDAKRARIELEQLEGRLVDRGEVERTVFSRARAERDAWQDWPLRISAEMAAELRIEEATLLPVLRRMVREHLEFLAERKIDDLGA